MSAPASLFRFATSAFANQTLMPASMCLSLQIPETEENTAGKVKVVGRYRTRWLSPDENYCASPPFTSPEDEFPDFPTSVLPPISLTLAEETEEEKAAPKIEVVRRWRTESIPANQPFCLTPVLTQRIPDNVWSLLDDVPTPPPSLMPIPDEAFYNGPPQATEPSLIPIYHRSRTQWIRRGEAFALTPGFHLEEFNAHACDTKPATPASWSHARAENPKKE
jgi:hypothetical protein